MNETKLNNIIHEVLFYSIEEQINRIVDLLNLQISINNKKRKRTTDRTEQEVIYVKTFEDLDDQIVIYEVNILLQNIHLIKQWYLQIIPTSPTLDLNKENTEKEYLYCKTVQKGVQNSEAHALKILDYIQLYHIQRLELCTTIKDKNNEESSSSVQLINALQVMDAVFKVKLKYLLSEIVNHYIIFWDIAKELYKLKSPDQ
ncbi:unnamed protein product [Cunninghamella blakesleeana]